MTVPHQDIRELIINVARNIFAKFGFRKTTMDEIAKAVRKGKSSLYYYFKSKEEIFEAVVEKETQLLRKEIKQSVDFQDTPQKKIRAYFITRMKFINHLKNFYEVLREEYFQNHASIEKIKRKYLEDELAMIKSILKEGVDKGIFVIKDLVQTSETIINALKGFEFVWASERESQVFEKKLNGLLDLLFNGLLVK